jgi:uncharacterized membrane protein
VAQKWTRGTWIGWSVMVFFAIGVAAYAFQFLSVGIQNALPAMAYHVPDRLLPASLHFGIGGLVLLIGPFQFVPRIRSSWPRLHRWMGRIYVAGCLLSGIAAFMLASSTNAGPVARTGFSLLAVFWIITTTMAFLKARGRDFFAHKRWMIRSYALTLAAVTLRIYLPVSMAGFGMPYNVVYPIISFACWVPNVIVAEWFLRRSKPRSA